MNEIEEGIELTFKVLMKVKDDEIIELKKSFKLETEVFYQEIHQRDDEIDQLKKEIRSLKSDKTAMKKSCNDPKKSHQDDIEEIMTKCRNELDIAHSTLEKIQNQNFIALEGLKSKASTVKQAHKNAMKEAKEKYTADVNAMRNDHQNQIKNLRHELDFVTAQTKSLSAALHESVRKRCLENAEMEQLKVKVQTKNISLFKSVLQRFGCRAAWITAALFPDISTLNGITRKNGQVRLTNNGSLDVYGFEFLPCNHCHPHSNGSCSFKINP